MSQPALKATPLTLAPSPDEAACQRFLEALGREYRLLCTKAYRVELREPALPTIPCLDHEAQLQGNPAPHASVYLEDADGHFHEVGIIPSERRVVLDAAATLLETPEPSRVAMLRRLRQLFPDHRVEEKRPSWVRGDQRVARVVRGQVRLRDVLLGHDGPDLRWQLERLRAIAELMEKESRASSWGIRTVTPPLLAGASVASYLVLGLFDAWIGSLAVEVLRYSVLTAMGGSFLYIGMKAVHLTEMGSRVWKRATEYRLILEARQRLAARVG